ncbi:MAG: hypothetical protein M3Z30_13895, partial [Gemmatimonadota bacterium]|nr:hypothetical protein [Gemmatimonadota bacterium]
MNKLCQGVAGVFVAAIFIAAVPGSPIIASAQTVQATGNWTAWSGCWRPDAPERAGIAGSAIAGGSSAVVCVVPLAVQLPSQRQSNAGAQIVTIEGGKVAMNDTIVTGASRTRTARGCTGPESARWSADGRRLYLQSRFDCAGGTVRTSDGMFAISPEGKWVNVESVRAGASRSVNVLRYSPTAIPETLPRQLADELRAGQLATGAARSAASAPLGASDVIDASRNTDSTVVTAWILERRQGFNVDASRLMALADAGVPSDVTDAMVAVSYPKAFTVATPGLASSGESAAT